MGEGSRGDATKKTDAPSKKVSGGFVADPAVLVPLDGPIFHLLSKKGESVDLVTTSSPSELAALALLESLDKTNPIPGRSAIEAASVRLVGELVASSLSGADVRDQLASLRSFRSTVLQLLSKKSNEIGTSERNKIQVEPSVGKSYKAESLVVGAYRVLLELSLSSETPISVARAIRSCLDIFQGDNSGGRLPDEEGIDLLHAEAAASIYANQGITWSDPVLTLFQALSYHPALSSALLGSPEKVRCCLHLLLEASKEIEDIIKNQSFSAKSKRNASHTTNTNDVACALDRGIEITIALKLVMTRLLLEVDLMKGEGRRSESPFQERGIMRGIEALVSELFDTLLSPLLTCEATSSDSLSVVGVVLGQVWCFQWSSQARGSVDEGDHVASMAARQVEELTKAGAGEHIFEWLQGLPTLNALAAVRGISASLPDSVIVRSGDSVKTDGHKITLLASPIGSYLLHQSQQATDPSVRLSAIRGTTTLLSRLVSMLLTRAKVDRHFSNDLNKLVEDALEVAFVTWENSSSRQITNALPSLFENIVKVIRVLNDAGNVSPKAQSLSIDTVVNRALSQPPNRKGRYIALETLLSNGTIEGMKLLELGGGNTLITSFMEGIAQSGNLSRPIADLMGKLLSIVRNEMNGKAGIVVDADFDNKKKRRKKEKELAKQGLLAAPPNEDKSQLMPEWIDIWADPIACSLVDEKSRARVAAFCLPMISTMVGGVTRRLETSHAFSAILHKLNIFTQRVGNEKILWAKLEVVRHARTQKLTKGAALTKDLRDAIAGAIPRHLLENALVHANPEIRLAAILSLEAVLPSHLRDSGDFSPLALVSCEMDLWRMSLPYAFKCSSKEYIKQILQNLFDLLKRASVADGDEEEGTVCDRVVSFCEFLVGDLFVRQAAYPGTVADKESFVLQLLPCILKFTCDDESLRFQVKSKSKSSEPARKAKPKKRAGKKGVPKRRLSQRQINTQEKILSILVSAETMSALIVLMHSMWDTTRVLSFEFALDLINQSILKVLRLPSFLISAKGQECWRARGFHLVSSPRQREADTGARMLSLLYATYSAEQRNVFLTEIILLTDDRIGMTEVALGLCKEVTRDDKVDDAPLPLAYGLLQALRLMLEQEKILKERDSLLDNTNLDGCGETHGKGYEGVVRVCFRAIRTSLAIVADIKTDDEIGDGPVMKPGGIGKAGTASSSSPLNVNTGAIGANAVLAGDETDGPQRFDLQRIIVGAWLLTKEACATLASAIIESPECPPPATIEDAGSLLIRTLVSLKHQGAAYAAHNALERISSTCNTWSDLDSFPEVWAHSILQEISSKETVRDSTLRRSTGFALGILSLLRSQLSRAGELCQRIIAQIIRYSLPPDAEMKKQIQQWNISYDDAKRNFEFSSRVSSESTFVDGKNFEQRTRVHALNILRLAILDAPMTPVMNKFVGDALISAIVGYNDESWKVRSSSTMVFSAAMLRVVDADKNASKLAKKASQSAVTARELFRCYPPLAHFLLHTLKEGIGLKITDEIKDMVIAQEWSLATTRDYLQTPLFPVLLLLSRLQPITRSLTEHLTYDCTDLTDPFLQPVIVCLTHKHHKVRIMAARALAVLCSGDGGESDQPSSCENLIRCCEELLKHTRESMHGAFNAQHGLLLGIRAILLTSSSPNDIFRYEDLTNTITYFATWANGTGDCPPLCAMIAVEIWASIDSTKVQHDMSFCKAVYAISNKMEELERANCILVGGAQLGMLAAKLACDASFSIIFSTKEDEERREDHVSKIQSLLTSDCYDVRLSATKAFKKRIWTKVDEFKAVAGAESNELSNVINPVCAMLMRALHKEIGRENLPVVLGAHTPTLRRLSRCVLECLAAMKSLCGRTTLPNSGLSAKELWTMTTSMRSLGQTKSEEGQTSKVTPLTGNAIEMFGFFLSSDLFGKEADYALKAASFCAAIRQSMDPSIHWAIRYSAASAIGTSAILQSPTEELDDVRLDLYLALLTFVQDSDEDVRNAAGKSLFSRGISAGPFSSNQTPCVPLKDLEVAYKTVGNRYGGPNLTARLLQSILKQCDHIEGNLKLVLSEFHQSEVCRNPRKLLNLNTERKIFEEEDTNPFEESLLVCQLATSLLCAAYPQVIDDSALHIMGEISRKCVSVIGIMQSRVSQKAEYGEDVMHNFTWCSQVFPAFHGLLLGCVASIYLGYTNASDVVDTARGLVMSLNQIVPNSVVHPCIMSALGVLSGASKGDEETKKGLLLNCFLVPCMMLENSTNDEVT